MTVPTKIVLSPRLPDALVDAARSLLPPGYELAVVAQEPGDLLPAMADAEYFVGFARTSLGPEF